jgi:hypothetical protein
MRHAGILETRRKLFKTIVVEDGRRLRHIVADEYYHILLWREASEATEFFTKGWSQTRNDLSTN